MTSKLINLVVAVLAFRTACAALNGHEGRTEVKKKGYMETWFTIDDAGVLRARTRTWSRRKLRGFTGAVFVALYDSSNQADSPIWFSNMHKYGVNGRWLGTSDRTENWTEQILLKSSVKSQRNQGQKILLDILKTGPKATEAFCSGLRNANQQELVELLNPNPDLAQPKSRNNSGDSTGRSRKVSATSLRVLVKRASSDSKTMGIFIEPRGVLPELLSRRDSETPDEPVPATYDPRHVYPNFTRPKGLVLLINNESFSGGMGHRRGTHTDCENLHNLFQNRLGYKVKVKQDLTAPGMEKAINEFRNDPMHTYSDSAVVIVLTHGATDSLYGVNGFGDEISVERFVSYLQANRCPALTKKPKIFIIQACRGEDSDLGYNLTPSADGPSRKKIVRGFQKFVRSISTPCRRGGAFRSVTPEENSEFEDASAVIRKLPNNADMLIACSSAPGYVSYRNEDAGSWFIQALCEVFNDKADYEHLIDMLTQVNQRVSETYESKSSKPENSRRKQMPEFSTRLRKKFYFYPGIYSDVARPRA